jgi:hypothetical protein
MPQRKQRVTNGLRANPSRLRNLLPQFGQQPPAQGPNPSIATEQATITNATSAWPVASAIAAIPRITGASLAR